MKSTSLFITSTEVHELHDRMINNFGGTPGIADPELLESLVFLPHSGYEDKQIRHLNFETIFEQAAALMQGFCTNHCFKDGNRAVGVMTALTFLKMNGFTLKISSQELLDFVLEHVVTKKADVKTIAKWLERCTV